MRRTRTFLHLSENAAPGARRLDTHRSRTRMNLGAVGLIVSLSVACGDSPTGPDGGATPQIVRIEVPEVAAENSPFTLKVTVFGPDTTRPLAGFSGAAVLSASAGAIEPAAVTLSGGTGTVQARVSGVTGEVTVTATVASLADSRVLAVGGDLLPGNPGDLASTAIQRRPFEVRPEDYSLAHPHFTGVPLSFNTLVLIFRAGTTVGEANRVLATSGARIVGGIPGTPAVPGILQVRLPTSTHEQLDAALERLQQEPSVDVAAGDVLEEPLLATSPGGHPEWVWTVDPAGGNWGFELSRVPQMWNLRPALVAAGAPSVTTGIVDTGFETGHEDLNFAANLSPGVRDGHGTHVAGTIGASFNNGKGVDGLNPFAALVAKRSQHYLDGFYDLVAARPDVRVINYSMGYYWATRLPTDPPDKVLLDANTDQALQAKVNGWGAAFAVLVSVLQSAFGATPLIVPAAGNDSNTGLGTQPAMYGSAAANAALRLGVPSIIVVENVRYNPSAPGDASRAPSSNVGGHVSAPGTFILSADTIPVGYSYKSGTSMAAPHVSGLAGYLLAIDPGLTAAQLRNLIVANAVPAGNGASPRIDAFASAMAIDQLRGNNRVLRMLLDIDDGTEDGNRRTDPGNSTIDYTVEDPTADCGPSGACRIDMADFRRFRDALLQADNEPDLRLDGSALHPKKDLNGDGEVGLPGHSGGEPFPRADFNGDGEISSTTVAAVPGFPGGATDLEVLQKLFSDHHYGTADLPDLLISADIAINPTKLRAEFPSAQIRSSVHPAGANVAQDNPRFRRLHTGNAGQGEGVWQVYTVATSESVYTARVVVLGVAGDTLARLEKTFAVQPGQDHYWDPGRIEVEVEPASVTLHPGESRQFIATVTGTENPNVTWTAAGGSITTGGLYTAGSTPGTFVVRATSVADSVAHGDAIVAITSPFPPPGTRQAYDGTARSLVKLLSGLTEESESEVRWWAGWGLPGIVNGEEVITVSIYVDTVGAPHRSDGCTVFCTQVLVRTADGVFLPRVLSQQVLSGTMTGRFSLNRLEINVERDCATTPVGSRCQYHFEGDLMETISPAAPASLLLRTHAPGTEGGTRNARDR
jgi:hypothetical protein